MSAEEAASLIQARDSIGMQPGNGTPAGFCAALGQRLAKAEIEDLTIVEGFALAYYDFFKPEYRDIVRVETIILGPAERAARQLGARIDYIPEHLNYCDRWHNEVLTRVFTAVVTPPDENGYMNRSSFGGLIEKSMIKRAKKVIVEVNRNAPWVNGEDLKIHVSEVDAIIENDVPLFEIPEIPITPVEEKMGTIIADMVPDGATIQLGLGGLANCIGHFLKDKKNLGVHTEVLSDSIMELYKCGAVNNSRKTHLPDKIAMTFLVGTAELSRWAHCNDVLDARPIGYINDPATIALNDNQISINNALMVDLTGQVASETIGTNQYSGTGGQVNFVIGAQKSRNGKSIIALPSTYSTKDGARASRLMPFFPVGTVTTTSRNDVDWVVTEYGAAKLKDRSISKRSEALIAIAHPDFRDELSFQAKKLGWLF